MEQFASGWKQNYYGKGDVIVYRLDRDGRTSGRIPVFGANVQMLIYGDAFWPTYTTGDNTDLVATDSMKNFIQRETLNFEGSSLEEYSRFLASTFLGIYQQVEGIQVSAVEIPYASPRSQSGVTFKPAGPERATARLEQNRTGIVEVVSGFRGFRLLRLGGSAFRGFVRDQYTTLPEIEDRPLHMWLDLEWRYIDPAAGFSGGGASRDACRIVLDTFEQFESGSIQQVIYRMGTRMLEEVPTIAEVHLEANNRTWDTIAEPSAALGVYTEARPPFGCLGLRLKR